METTAQKIAEQLHDDGQVWETDGGITFGRLVAEESSRADWRDGYRTGEVVRYTFLDGSVITEAGAAWDFGYLDCFCWQGVGHTEECTANNP